MTTYVQNQPNRASLLRRTLFANSAFCVASGVLSILGAGPLAKFLGPDVPLALVVLGVGLLLYAAMLYQGARLDPIHPLLTWVAIVMDTLWVVGSVVLLVTGWVPFTPAGAWAVAIVAVIVADFAIVQFLGWRRLTGDR